MWCSRFVEDLANLVTLRGIEPLRTLDMTQEGRLPALRLGRISIVNCYRVLALQGHAGRVCNS
jgi:hypothetical protein